MSGVKRIIKDALLYFLQIFIYAWPSFFAGNLIFGAIVYFILGGFYARIVEMVSSILILCVLLFIFAYKRAYKKIEFHGISLLISLILTAGLQLVYAILFRYNAYTGAGAYYLAHFLYSQEWKAPDYDVPAYLYIIAIIIVFPLYIISVMSGEYLGKKKRLQDRDDLTKTTLS